MKKPTWTEYRMMATGGKIPRKSKKRVIGTRISKKKLREEINKGVLCHCPKCRHLIMVRSTGNMAEYPEVWEYNYCANCGLIISGADNSYPVDLIQAAEMILDDPDENNGRFKSLYDAVEYIGENMKEYI